MLFIYMLYLLLVVGMVPGVVSVHFGLFRHTVEFVGIKLQVISIGFESGKGADLGTLIF